MTFGRNLLITFAACMTLIEPCSAEAWPPLGDNPNFTHLMMDGAQDVGEVFAFAQDSKGFIWIGGKNGLARYDGYRFHIYLNSPTDPQSLSANYIRDIFEDSHGELWVATVNGGVSRLNRDRDNFDRIEYVNGSHSRHDSETIYHVMEDSYGNIWFAGDDGIGLYDRAQKKIVQQLQGSILDKYTVSGIAQDGDNGYAISTAGGFFYWNKHLNQLERFEYKANEPNGLPSNFVRSVITDSAGRIWLAHDKGLSRFDPHSKQFENFIITNAGTKAPGTPVWSIYQDKQNTLWLSTDGNGLMYFDPDTKRMGSYTSSAYPSSLSHSVVRRVFQDKAGDLWMGMFPIGVNHFDRSNNYMSLYNNFVRNREGMFRNQVWAFVEDEKGNLWLGIDSLGLVYFDRKHGTFSQTYEGFDFSKLNFPHTVLSLFKDSHQNLWFGSWAEGVGRLNLKTKQYDLFRTPQGSSKSVFPSRHVWSFMETRDGDIYIGTSGDGFVTYSYTTNEFTTHRRAAEADDKSLMADNVWFMHEGKDGILWMATSGGVLIYYPKTGEYQRYRHDSKDETSVAENRVTSLLEDSKGRMWVSTMGGGLDLWQPATHSFTHLRVNDGLISNSVHGVVEDRKGLLWVSARAGLSAFNADTHQLTNYTEKNWLQKGAFSDGAFLRLSTGELVFGGVNGFNIFDPEKMSTDTTVPPIYFTEFEVLNKPVLPTSADSPLKKSILDTNEIVLNHHQDVFSLAFAALNYRIYDDTRYRYFLEGFDNGWRDATNGNRVTYTHLDAGTYTFKVQASNRPDIWNDNQKSISIIILPAPWRTWWAYSLYVLFALSIGGWYLQAQRNKIRQSNLLNAKLLELDKLKDDFMANTSHELRTPVHGILGMVQALRDEVADELPAAARVKLEIIHACGRRLARLINDILDFSAIKKHELLLHCSCVKLGTLVSAVIAECQIHHANPAIQVDNQLKADLPLVYVDESKATTILHNIIANAFKFTEKGFIGITSLVTETQVCIEVADTGTGIDEKHLESVFASFEQIADSGARQKNGTGLGLAVCKYLAELHGGTLTVRSTLGVGSVFSVSLPRVTQQQLAEYQARQQSSTASAVPAIKASTATQDQAVAPPNIKLAAFYPKAHATNPNDAFVSTMVVDDEPVNRMVLRHMLLRRNHIVYEAVNGQEAVDAIEQGLHCDLVLLDVMMPVMSGIEASEKIRCKYSPEQLPIVFVTAKTQQQDRQQCLLAGGNAFLSKPVTADELLACMDHVFSRKIA